MGGPVKRRRLVDESLEIVLWELANAVTQKKRYKDFLQAVLAPEVHWNIGPTKTVSRNYKYILPFWARSIGLEISSVKKNVEEHVEDLNWKN